MALTQADGTLAPWVGLVAFAVHVIVALAAAAYRLAPGSPTAL
ncbi:hypothetical protein [Micromonospora sp. 067-2]